MVLEAAEAELRAQVERAVAAGLRPTHLDAHMAAAMLPGLLEVQVRLGREYGLFPVLPRSITLGAGCRCLSVGAGGVGPGGCAGGGSLPGDAAGRGVAR